jgi:two-component system sensor histidine kinase YesM
MVEEASLTNMEHYIDNLEREIGRLWSIQYTFLMDNELTKLSTLSNLMTRYEQNEMLARFNQKLYLVSNSNDYVDTVSIMFPKIGKQVSTIDGISSINESDIREAMLTNNFRKNGIAEFSDDGIHITVQNPAGEMSNGELPYYIINILLSREKMMYVFKQLADYEQCYVFLYDEDKEFTLSTLKGDMIANDFTGVFEQLPAEVPRGIQKLRIGDKVFSVVFDHSSSLNLTLAKFIPQKLFMIPFEKYSIWFWSFTFVSLLIVAIACISIYKYVFKPLNRLMTVFGEVEKGNLKISIKHNIADEFGFIYGGFNQMVERLEVLQDQIFRQKILTQQAQMRHLQTQINPHFLFNSFYTLHGLASMEGNDYLADFAQKLGKYYEFITRSGTDNIPLSREFEHARIYTEIQSMRFQNRILITFGELPQQFDNIKVPRMILQPVIENAFEHSLKGIPSGGMLVVGFEADEEFLHIFIEDNGHRLSEEKLNYLCQLMYSEKDDVEITALLNIHRRLSIYSGGNSRLSFTRSRLGGLRVEICICKGEGHV